MNTASDDSSRGTQQGSRMGLRVLLLVALLITIGAVAVTTYRHLMVDSANTIALPGKIWTCERHPEVRKLEPGRCPLCGRILVEEYRGPHPTIGSLEAHAETPKERDDVH